MTRDWTWPGPDALPKRAGQCFTLAMETLVANYGEWAGRLWLVHGVLHPDRAAGTADWHDEHPGLPLPPLNPHAWLEVTADDGELAVDPVLRMVWPAAEHAELFGAEAYRRYRADIAVTVATRRDSYGPWDARTLAAWHVRKAQADADPRFSMAAAVARHLERSS